MSKLSRRDFLNLSARALLWISGLLGVGALWRFLSHPTEPPPPTVVDLGPAVDFPLGSRTLRPEIPAVVIHDEAGFWALSLACPHLGCTVEQDASGFTCPCHGSTFGKDGSLLTSPAKVPLAALQVEQDEVGHLILHLR